MIKICCIIPSLGPGGMERVMSVLLSNFEAKDNIEVDLVLFAGKREIFFQLPDNVQIYEPSFKFDHEKRIQSLVRTIHFIRRKIKTLNPDTVLSFGEDWNNLVLLSTIGLKTPVFVSDRAQPGKKRKSTLQEILRNRLYPRAKGIIVQTEKAAAIYREKFPGNRIYAIGNPFNIPKTQSEVPRENIILSVGRLINTKHFDILIEIYSKVEFGDWKLVIIGGDSGEAKNMGRLQSLINNKGLQGSIELTGTVSDVEKWYKRSKIFAFTSSSEGFPNVIGEAMLYGLPVVAFDCVAGPSDMIMDGENGYLVPLFNNRVFEEKLKCLMTDDQLRSRMGTKSREFIKKFSAHSVSDRYLNMILGEKTIV